MCPGRFKLRLQAAAGVDLAETLQLSAVVIALHLLKRMHKSSEISLRQLTVLLPLHGAGVGSQLWRCAILSILGPIAE